MFTPILAYADNLHREAVDTVLHEAAKDASIQGYFTPAIVQNMRNTLVYEYNFKADDIQISATSTPQPRNTYIQATITVPRGPIFVLNIFNQGPKQIVRTVQVMSEL